MRITPFVSAAIWLLPMSMQAEGVKTLTMSTVFTSAGRAPLQTYLPQTTSTDRGPIINLSAGKAVINGRTLTLTTIKAFTFDIQVVDGIAEIPAAEDEASNWDVYSIDGLLVRTHANSLEGLPKGIYVVNGKKHIVR